MRTEKWTLSDIQRRYWKTYQSSGMTQGQAKSIVYSVIYQLRDILENEKNLETLIIPNLFSVHIREPKEGEQVYDPKHQRFISAIHPMVRISISNSLKQKIKGVIYGKKKEKPDTMNFDYDEVDNFDMKLGDVDEGN